MVRRCLRAAFISCAAIGTAQIDGQFYLEKASFAKGEPVFLYFKITNTGSRAENVYQASPDSFCSGYDITITGPNPKHDSCEPWGIAGSCLSSNRLLKPGEKQVELLLLNFDHEIDAPGDYRIEAIRRLPSKDRKQQFEFRETLYFHLDEEVLPAQSLQPWIDQLKSNDFMTRIEAAKVLASLAPRSLEDVIIAFAADPQFRGFAPLALHGLNTSRSMAAMAELLRTSQPGSSESMDSDRYLAQSGDEQWFPLLRDIALKNGANLPYVANAAELGADNMVPSLLSLLSSPDRQFTVINAVSALGYTASRSAIPVLIDLLNWDRDIADRAAGSLQELTHRKADGQPREQYPKWLA
jgi:hypothetical protein